MARPSGPAAGLRNLNRDVHARAHIIAPLTDDSRVQIQRRGGGSV